MIGVDTNILVRYFTQDDAEQAKIVEQIIDTHPSTLATKKFYVC